MSLGLWSRRQKFRFQPSQKQTEVWRRRQKFTLRRRFARALGLRRHTFKGMSRLWPRRHCVDSGVGSTEVYGHRQPKKTQFMWWFHESPFFTEIYKRNAAAQIEPRTRTHTHTLCASLRARNACQDFTRATLYANLQVKCRRMQQTKLSPERGRTLCASLRSRNACQDFTRATFCGNWPVKCRRPEWAPWSSTGLRRNPSVWTHCFWNQSHKVRGGQ